eukprot:TRINITY_DN36455_c0_g1_i1.p1 TRINITY_DN36455_c0_g1~~TRINITY_DN36455_c0_g1_i1.p1  ORF type:complete len:561 (-),score=141.95 TRINITY_DN36455_c0_g1_i1:296-1978(-)
MSTAASASSSQAKADAGDCILLDSDDEHAPLAAAAASGKLVNRFISSLVVPKDSGNAGFKARVSIYRRLAVPPTTAAAATSSHNGSRAEAQLVFEQRSPPASLAVPVSVFKEVVLRNNGRSFVFLFKEPHDMSALAGKQRAAERVAPHKVKCLVLVPDTSQLADGTVSLRHWLPALFPGEAIAPALVEQPLLRLNRLELRTYDLNTMTEGEFLNDTLLDFLLQLSAAVLVSPHQKTAIHVMSTAFFQALTSRSARTGEEGWTNVSRWTNKLQPSGGLLSRECIFLPVNEGNFHWWLAAICRPAGRVVRGDQRIICMDSGYETPSKEESMRFLRGYLRKEWDENQGGDSLAEPLRAFSVKVPGQENSYDCGLFVLEYVAYLLRRPQVLMKLGVESRECWFSQKLVSHRRKCLLDLLNRLTKAAQDKKCLDVLALLRQDPDLRQAAIKAFTDREKAQVVLKAKSAPAPKNALGLVPKQQSPASQGEDVLDGEVIEEIIEDPFAPAIAYERVPESLAREAAAKEAAAEGRKRPLANGSSSEDPEAKLRRSSRIASKAAAASFN